jgi:hypothetical protein
LRTLSHIRASKYEIVLLNQIVFIIMPLHIVNLGSSFAAGPGIAPQVDTQASRSGENYAHIIARRLGAELTDLSVSGATLMNLLSEPQLSSGRTFPPQISGIPEAADIVMVLGGGNDMGYIGGLFMDSVEAYWIPRMILNVSRWFTGPADISVLSTEELAERYSTVLDTIHGKAPKAQVLVVEYLTLLGTDLKPGNDVVFDASLLEGHKAKAEQVRTATAKAVQGREAWCTRVPVAEASIGHGIGSKEPWVNGFGLGLMYKKQAPYHPNAEGMVAVAEMVCSKLAALGIAP